MDHLHFDIQSDINAIGRIPSISKILEVICRSTGMGFAAVARVTETKWVACAVRDEIQFGLIPGSELKLETTICNEIRQNHQAVIIDNVAEDAAFSCHHTPLMYGFQSYISLPIILKNGKFFGTLCAIDPKPARLNNIQTIGMFGLFADLIAIHLDTMEQLNLTETKLIEEQQSSELREQFIAILGHDLRNPVTAVTNSARILQKMPLDASAMRFVDIVHNASFRMNGLIENVLNFARGRLGGGVVLSRKDNEPIEKLLNQVIDEMRLISPEQIIETSFNLAEPVNCDGRSVAQLFANLLSNAVKYGKPGAPVTVTAKSDASAFSITVCNPGEKIPDAVMLRLFQPFYRGDIEPNKEGLGLGLYIASEIARAHNGTLTVRSTEQETCFTFQLASYPLS